MFSPINKSLLRAILSKFSLWGILFLLSPNAAAQDKPTPADSMQAEALVGETKSKAP